MRSIQIEYTTSYSFFIDVHMDWYWGLDLLKKHYLSENETSIEFTTTSYSFSFMIAVNINCDWGLLILHNIEETINRLVEKSITHTHQN